MHRPSFPIALVLLAVGVLALGTGARAEAPVIYKWVDENGVAHYTTDRERIPSSIRDRVIQGGEAARGADWLRSDAGPPGVSPAPLGSGASPAPVAPGHPSAAAPAPSERPAEDVELPEDSTGVHAVEAEPDWSQAPGGEATWAPGDLGEDGKAPPPATAKPATARPSPPIEPPAVETPPALDETATAARAPAPPPPPPPPPLEADGAPVPEAAPVVEEEPAAVAATPAREEPAPMAEPEAPELAPAALPTATREPAAEAAPAEPAVEPSAPAAVASPAPRNLAPDEQAELAALDAQITEVETKIASDEEALMVLISENQATEHDALVDDPQFRDIAQRLPKLQADLERLRERRAQIQPAVSRP